MVEGRYWRGPALAAHRLDGRPARLARALLGDVAPLHVGIGLSVPRSEPGPAAQPVSSAEPADIADLGHENGGLDRPDPVQGLDGPITPMVPQSVVDLPLDHGDLPVEDLDQIS